MQHKTSLFVCLVLVAGSGCGGDAPDGGPPQPVAARPESLFPNLDVSRLQSPRGWDRFEERVQDAQVEILNEPVTVAEAPAIAEQARQFADRRAHPHNLIAIPQALLLCAQAHARAGDADAALRLLAEVRDTGGLFADMLADSAFDGLRDTEPFQAFVEAAAAETTEELFGAWLVRSPPLFPLDDLLAIPARPPLPAAAETGGRVTVVFTGPKLTPDAIQTLEEAAQQGASVHAIVAEGGAVPPGVVLHIAGVPPEQLVADATALTWFANKENQVVAYLRPFSGAGLAKAIVQRLSSTESR